MIVDLSGKVAIVTGAGQGIGEGIARLFAKSGAKVGPRHAQRARTARRWPTPSSRAAASPGSTRPTSAAASEVKRVVAQTVERFGRLDIVVHNAAVYPVLPIEQLSDEDLDLTLCGESQGRILAHSGVPAAPAQAGRRPFPVHLVRDRPERRHAGHRALRGLQMRHQRPDPHGGARICAREHHRERRRARLHTDPGDGRAGRAGGARADGEARSRSASWASRPTSPTPCCSSLRTPRPTSPARRSSSTADRRCRKARWCSNPSTRG